MVEFQAISKQLFLYSIAVDNNGVLWAASNKGVYRIEKWLKQPYTQMKMALPVILPR